MANETVVRLKLALIFDMMKEVWIVDGYRGS